MEGMREDVTPVEWNLGRVMGDRGIRFAAELHRRLVDVLGPEAPSAAQVSRMVQRRPERLTIRSLEGLCEVLACTPGELLTRAPSRRSSSMRLFSRVEELEAATGLVYVPGAGAGSAGGFPSEADWGYRATGYGTKPGTLDGGGWVVTFARNDRDEREGHLIAYEVDGRSKRTGRCALIRSPWTEARGLFWPGPELLPMAVKRTSRRSRSRSNHGVVLT